jgi:CMP-N-acetylneuraminic acid synthetase
VIIGEADSEARNISIDTDNARTEERVVRGETVSVQVVQVEDNTMVILPSSSALTNQLTMTRAAQQFA